MSSRLIIFILLLLGSAFTGAAQDYDIFDSYGINEGLPQSSVWHITQDKNGFMWFSTSDGICRFDGYNFTVYRHNPADEHSLLNSTNNHFYIDSEGDLWTISRKGICLYNYEKDNFTVVYKDDSKRPFYYHNNCFFGEYGGYIWASMPLQGMLKVDKKKRKAEMVTRSAANRGQRIIPETEQKGLFNTGFIADGKIWISMASDRSVIYDIKEDRVDKPHLPYIYAFSDFNDSQVVASTRSGLLLLNKKTYATREIPIDVEIMAKQIYVIPDSQLIIASFNGLVYVDIRSWKVTKIIRSFERDKKQTYSNIHCVYEDRSGNLWIGTNGDGIKKLRAPNKKFRFYSSFSISNLVKSIYVRGEKLFVGYFKNDLDIFDREKGLIANKVMMMDTFNYHHVYAITSVDSNTLLLCKADPNIVYTYSLTTGKLTSLYTIIKNVLPKKDIATNEPVLFKYGNMVYTNVGNHIVSLDITDAKNIKASLFYSFRNEIPTYDFIDSKGTFWIGTINGLYYLKDSKAIMVTLPEMIQVKTINEDVNGNIWVGTLEGMYIIDSKKKFVKKYTEKNGLANGFIYGIIRDGRDMWFSHNKGLSKYSTLTGKFRHYTKEDGLQSNEFNTGAYFKAADGTLFFGGIYGTNAFRPEDIKDNPHVPNVVITDIKLFDKNLVTDTAYWNIRKIELRHTENSLTFEFAGLEYTNAEKNRYAYIMEGLDEKWIYCGKTRFARYPALPPGTYYFKVKASNNDGVWQEEPTVIKVVIVPPFWQTWWFRVLCVVLLIVIVAVIISAIQRQRTRAQRRAMELQQKIQQERERISRDLHDNVGTQLSLISNNIEWVEHPLKEITEQEKSDKLQQVNQMSRDIIATLRETIWALKKEQISLEEFSDKLKAFVQKQLAVYPQIGLDYTEEINEAVILGPSEALNLFRICQEAIANALKYSGATVLSIEIESAGGRYKVSVKDNGKGFDPAAVDANVQNGIENMKYRAADIGGALVVNTEQGKGTEIQISKK